MKTKWLIIGGLGLAAVAFVGYPRLKAAQLEAERIKAIQAQIELVRHIAAVEAGEEEMRQGVQYDPALVRGNKPASW